MTKVKCVTQVMSLQGFKAVTDIPYYSYRGKPFDVKNKEDLAFFKNKKQFAVGMLDTRKPITPAPEESKELEKWLNKISGLGKKAKDKLISKYKTKTQLISDYIGGADIREDITKKDAERIVGVLKNE